MKKITKKEIIKNMLVTELRSPAQIERVQNDREHGAEYAIQWDLHSGTDDELIDYVDQLRKKIKKDSNELMALYGRRHKMSSFNSVSNGHIARHILTPKAYLLLMAYKGSYCVLRKYFDHHKKAYSEALYDAAQRSAWRLEYMDICNQLRSDIINKCYKE